MREEKTTDWISQWLHLAGNMQKARKFNTNCCSISLVNVLKKRKLIKLCMANEIQLLPMSVESMPVAKYVTPLLYAKLMQTIDPIKHSECCHAKYFSMSNL